MLTVMLFNGDMLIVVIAWNALGFLLFDSATCWKMSL
ncbi:hypothetical protein MUK42_02374 [Musa troglodytarum]|uniref:Uncharacterized protein n=1 Tax=Musa troglodytarum TaxID=320322 RepID=A0A9E7ENS9_9LILI|nr:hypothetical protein MUK42_02374 [Musa troglodytarum]